MELPVEIIECRRYACVPHDGVGKPAGAVRGLGAVGAALDVLVALSCAWKPRSVPTTVSTNAAAQ